MGTVGWSGILILALVLLLVFGPRQLPKLGRQLGHGMREFKDTVGQPAGEIKAALDAPREARAALNPATQLKAALDPRSVSESPPAVIEGEIAEPVLGADDPSQRA